MKDLVLVHGWGMSSAIFETLANELASECNVHAIELPGYGGRAGVEPYTLDTLVRCIADEAPPRCAVLGWSFGAQLALAWAARAPRQVEKLVIVSGTPCFVQRPDWPYAIGSAAFRDFADEFRSDRERALRRFTSLQARGDEQWKRVARTIDGAVVDAASVSDEVLEQGLHVLRDTDLRPLLEAILQRTLVVHGARDELVPMAAAEYLAANVEESLLEIVESAAHAPFVSEPARVAKRIAAFVR